MMQIDKIKHQKKRKSISDINIIDHKNIIIKILKR